MTVGQLLRTPRWIGLTLLTLVVVVAFIALGKWQFDRSYRLPDGFTDEPASVALSSVSAPGTPMAAGWVDRQVTAAGTYDAAEQHVVPGRSLDGATVRWVVTPLVLADGSSIDVVRGWTAGAEAGLDRPPVGPVQITGRMRPPDASVTGPVPAGGRSFYLVRTAQSPPDPLSLQPVPSSPPRSTGGTKQFYLQNAIYTSQWWIFAVLVVLYWWRLLRTDQAGLGADEHEVVPAG